MKTKLFPLLAIMALVTLASCEKTETDARDQYLGVWKGVETFKIPELDINDVYQVTFNVSKTDVPNQIKVIDAAEPSFVYTAKVNAGTYIYDKYTSYDSEPGYTMYYELTGSGKINGNTITETGNILYSYNGYDYSGSWERILTKQ